MAYVAPTPTSFKARFPEFSALGNDYVALILVEAARSTDATWINQDDRAAAEMYLAAHMMAVEGRLIDATSGGGVNITGAVKRRKVGDVETEFAGTSVGGGGDGTSPYSTTSYGRQWLSLLKRNVLTTFVV